MVTGVGKKGGAGIQQSDSRGETREVGAREERQKVTGGNRLAVLGRERRRRSHWGPPV